MGSPSKETRYMPLAILLLVAALVATLGFWAAERHNMKPAHSNNLIVAS